jgi:HK97 family phage prohead protease
VPPKQRVKALSDRALTIRAVDTTELPPGICGRITYIGLRYNQIDDYGTMFKPGCLAKSAAEKVATGRVKCFADHTYRIRSHVGVIRKVEDVADDVIVVAELFDTVDGRDALEYAKACHAAKAQTGMSIGFYYRDSELVEVDGVKVLAFTEVELQEFSMTPMPAVEGADLLAARHQPAGDRQQLLRRALDQLIAALPESEVRAAVDARYGNATTQSDSAPPATRDAEGGDSQGASPELASMDDRLAAVRQSFAPTP